MNEKSLNKLHNKIDKLVSNITKSKNIVSTIKADNDKRYKAYLELLKNVDIQHRQIGKYNTIWNLIKTAFMIIVLYKIW